MVMGAKQLKVGLRVDDLDHSASLYWQIGFREIPNDEQPELRYLTFGHAWLILSSRFSHGYHDAARGRAAKAGPLGSGFVLAVPTTTSLRYANCGAVKRCRSPSSPRTSALRWCSTDWTRTATS